MRGWEPPGKGSPALHPPDFRAFLSTPREPLKKNGGPGGPGGLRGCARDQVRPFGPIQGISRAMASRKTWGKAAVAGKAPGTKGRGGRPFIEPLICKDLEAGGLGARSHGSPPVSAEAGEESLVRIQLLLQTGIIRPNPSFPGLWGGGRCMCMYVHMRLCSRSLLRRCPCRRPRFAPLWGLISSGSAPSGIGMCVKVGRKCE